MTADPRLILHEYIVQNKQLLKENKRRGEALSKVKESLVTAKMAYINNRDHFVGYNICEALETIESLEVDECRKKKEK